MKKKYTCQVIRDLMPQVRDRAASEQSATLVREHLAVCPACVQVWNALHQPPVAAYRSAPPQRSAEPAAHRPAPPQRSAEPAAHRPAPPAPGTAEPSPTQKKKHLFRRLLGLGLAALLITQAALLLPSLIARWTGEEYTTENPAAYRVWQGHIKGEASRRKSQLLLFPASLPEGVEVEQYYYSCSSKVLGNQYQLALVCVYDSDGYQAEKERLQTLQVGEGKGARGTVYNTTGFRYPAYIALFRDEACEYALCDDSTRRVVYVFSQSAALFVSVLDRAYRTVRYQPPTGGVNLYA